MTERRPRLRPMAPDRVEGAVPPAPTVSEAELAERLRAALAALPPAERAAAVVAFGLDEGVGGVARAMELGDADADALTRSALQLLRGALADVDVDEGVLYARLRRHRRTGPPHTDPAH